MPLFLTTPKGAALTAYSRAERDAKIAAGMRPESLEESPPHVMEAEGWDTPYYAWRSPFTAAGGSVWANHYGASKGEAVKPGFDEIFTDGRGPLTGPEVREVERRYGVLIDDSTAVRAYNNQRAQDLALYGEDLTMEELAAALPPEAWARLQEVHSWVSMMLGAEPLYFSFQVDKAKDVSFVLIEGIPQVTMQSAAKIPGVGVAFPGPHGRVRDVFNLTQFLGGGPNPKAAGLRAVQLPGRDRAYRITTAGAFDSYLYSPVHVISQMQVRQLEEGRTLTLPLSPIVPKHLLSWSA